MTRIIGIDCATQAVRTGLALGRRDGDGVQVDAVHAPRGETDTLDTLAGWLGTGEDTLLAVDAPLGWPRALAASLAGHRAGQPIAAPANALFRRATDAAIQRRLRKRPMDVGADRIARTAHAALALVSALAARSGNRIECAWHPTAWTAPGLVEVYPGGTLTALGLNASGYKGEAHERRVGLLDALSARVTLQGACRDDALANDHVFDAVLCALAGADFLAGRCPGPEDPALAEQEGWIWVRDP